MSTTNLTFVSAHILAVALGTPLMYLVLIISKSLLLRQIVPSAFRHIPGPPSQSWVKGNLGQLFNPKGLPFHQRLVDAYGGMVKVYGFFGDEQLYISDPRALHNIILKDHDAFEETSVFTETNKVIFGPGLIAVTGDQHRKQRKIVSPIFALPELRRLTPVFYDIGEKLVSVIEREINVNKDSVFDMSEWVGRTALESVGRTILGHSFDPLDSPSSNPYTAAVKELIPTIFSLSLVRQFAPFLSKLGSPSFRRRLVEWTPNQAVQKVKEMSDAMHTAAMGILKSKKEELGKREENGVDDMAESRDVISTLLRANEKAAFGEKLSDDELAGQITVLIFGAQDTTSSSLSRMLHLLASHPAIQAKVREEIRTAMGGEQRRLGFEEIMGLPWLDAVMKETLRLYPPVPFVRRTAIKERTIPYSKSGSLDDDEITAVMIPEGTTIFVSIAGSNRLESVWGPDAKEWRPERWLNPDGDIKEVVENKVRLPGIYSGMMSFLGGSRSCVGYRFAQIEMKIILATLLSKFTFAATRDEVVWNLSQIISSSVRTVNNGEVEEKKGLPLIVQCAPNM
ncbi:cytochrome P450 [Pluteus cervinus]|uniref:Cytochrome P450 n=1 Tax=Pluteus cervinus TaxID=181527 RepID=A0ACD3AEW8_9AGAR|nr:cytochrome P450 [Pluteus cervinus]